MATRTIVTSQPDVACEVCERRLLRGEQQNVFLAAGRRRIVCELCAPRAAHEGWTRETDSQSLPPMRPRRGRSLFERLPAPFRMRPLDRSGGALGAAAPDAADVASEHVGGRAARRASRAQHAERHGASGIGATTGAHEPYDLFAEPEPLGWQDEAPLGEPSAQADVDAGRGDAREQPSEYVEQALAVFNASEFPRRVAGVTRSLGAPGVN